MASPSQPAETHLVIRGHVQGVYFRGSLQRQAEQRQLTGWVRNRADGAVEAVLQGDPEAIRSVIAWAHHGPRGAVVESVDVEWSQVDSPLDRFEVRP